MPYIKKNDRVKYLPGLSQIKMIETKGDLEFCIFFLMKKYMEDREVKYANLHDCTYAAQHCADEFRRRFLDKREDEAIESNGDV